MLSIAQLVAQRSNRVGEKDKLRGEIGRLNEQLAYCYSELREYEKADALAFAILLEHAEQGRANLGEPPE